MRGWGAGALRVLAAVLVVAAGGLFGWASPAVANITQYVLPGVDPFLPVEGDDHEPFAAGAGGVWWWNHSELLHLSPQGTGAMVLTDAPPLSITEEVALEPGGGVLVGLYGEPGGLVRVAPSGATEALPLPASLVEALKAEEPHGYPISYGSELSGSPGGTSWFALTRYRSQVPAVVQRSAAGVFTAVALHGIEGGSSLVTASDGTAWLGITGPGGVRGMLHVSGPEAYVDFPIEVFGPVAAGPSGEVDVTQGNRVVSLSESGNKIEYALPPWSYEAENIAVGPEGAIWLLAKVLPEDEAKWGCSQCVPLVKLMPSGGYTAYWLGGPEPTLKPGLALANIVPASPYVDDRRWLQGLAVDREGNAWVAASVGSEGGMVRELIKVPPSTPASWPPGKPASGGTTPTHSVVHGIDISAEVRQLNRLKATARALDTASKALDVLKVAVAGAAIVSAPELSVALLEPDLTESAVEFVSDAANQAVIEDPPDPHYRRVTRLSALHLSPVHAGGGVSRRAAVAWNRLIGDQLHYTADIRALVASVQRAEGAARAKSCSWLARQNALAHTDALLAAHALTATRRLAAALRRELARTPLAHVQISAAALAQAAAQLAAHGLPATAQRALSQLGVSPANQASLASMVGTLQPKPISLLDALTAIPSGTQTATALTGLAGASQRARCRRTHHPRRKH